MGYTGLSIAEKPVESLDRFQLAVIELQSTLGSKLNVAEFSELFQEREIANARTIRQMINKGHNGSKLGPITIRTTREITQQISEGKGNGLETRLATGLVSLKTFPDLKQCARQLYFRSMESMFWALSEATGISYYTIRAYRNSDHKHPLYVGRKEVKECLENWVLTASQGNPLPIDPKYRGIRKSVALAEMLTALDFLKSVGWVKSKSKFADKLQARAKRFKARYKRNTVLSGYLNRGSTTKYIPVELYLAFRSFFTPYSVSESYRKGQLLCRLDKGDPHKPYADIGRVDEVVSSRSIYVMWAEAGRTKMAQDGPYGRYDSGEGYRKGDRIYLPYKDMYGVVQRAISGRRILVKLEDEKVVRLQHNVRLKNRAPLVARD